MTENDKKEFAMMMCITWQSYGRNHPDKETIRFWFEKLSEHYIRTVGKAFDEWIDTMARDLPSYKNIKDLCKPKPTIFARLPSSLAIAENHRHAVEVKQAVEQMTKPKRDMKAWAKKIIANPGNYPNISFKLAKEALGNEI